MRVADIEIDRDHTLTLFCEADQTAKVDAMFAEIDRLRAELETAEYALRSKGYRKSCEIPACNCGDQWSHGGNAEARLRELSSELHGSPVDMNGKTLLAGLSELVGRAENAEAEVERLRADAERYRWLRDMNHWPACFGSHSAPEPVRGSDLDAAIDAALKEPK